MPRDCPTKYAFFSYEVQFCCPLVDIRPIDAIGLCCPDSLFITYRSLLVLSHVFCQKLFRDVDLYAHHMISIWRFQVYRLPQTHLLRYKRSVIFRTHDSFCSKMLFWRPFFSFPIPYKISLVCCWWLVLLYESLECTYSSVHQNGWIGMAGLHLSGYTWSRALSYSSDLNAAHCCLWWVVINVLP